jgi:hypothetical protein
LTFLLGGELVRAGTRSRRAGSRFLIVFTRAGFEREFARRAARKQAVAPPAWALQDLPPVERLGGPICS